MAIWYGDTANRYSWDTKVFTVPREATKRPEHGYGFPPEIVPDEHDPCDAWPYVRCPVCNGTGGHEDYWGEYDECWACNDERTMTEADAWWLIEMEIVRDDWMCAEAKRIGW